MTDDLRWMRRALTLAKRGKFTHPNPKVGAVIVQNGMVVGEGWHVRPGTPHAEAMAFANADGETTGATLYVTLEPCAHTENADGSPRIPCVQRCIMAGVSKVVCAMEDPDPRTSGRSFGQLRNAGIEVVVGVGAEEARVLNRPFIKHRTTGLPFLLHKVAMTLDGKIATVTGSSRWITGDESRAYVHRALRNTVDALIVGVGTVIADNPSLTTRLSSQTRRNEHDPLRVVIDSELRIPVSAKVVAPGTVIYATDSPLSRKRVSEIVERGADVILLSSGENGRVDLTAAMQHLAPNYGALSLLLESGGELAAGFYKAALVDTAIFFVAPKIVGGRMAPTPIGGEGLVEEMSHSYRTGKITVKRFGADIALMTDIIYDTIQDV